MKNKILPRYPLGNPRRLWRQKHFILSNFAATAKDMDKAIRHCKEAGFNLLKLGWATPQEAEQAVYHCQRYGIPLLYQNMARYGGMQHNRYYEKSDLEGVIAEHRQYEQIFGYYIWDEPFMDDQLDEARALTDLCEKQAPDKLPFCVAIPSYNEQYTWDNGQFPLYLQRYLTKIDPPVLSLDYYPVGLSEHNEKVQLDESRIWLDLGLMKQLAQTHEMPLWFYYQGQNLKGVDFFIFPMVRCMMYAGALYGAKGLQHYTARASIINKEGDPDIFFEEQKQIHKEFENLGNTLMALTCKKVFHDDSIAPKHEAYEQLSDKLADGKHLLSPLPVRLSAAEFEDGQGNEYLMILNRDYTKSQQVRLSLQEHYRLYEVSKEDGKQRMIDDDTDSISVFLDAGDGKLFRLQKAKEEPFTVEYRLVE